MQSRVEVLLESITLQDQRVRGAEDDYLLSVVHLEVQHRDVVGAAENCAAAVDRKAWAIFR